MNFNDPQWFWGMIPAAVLVIVLAVRAGKKRKDQLKLLLGSAADDPDAVRVSKSARRFRIFLFLAVLFFLTAAAARPFWSSRMLPFSRQGRDVMILFDVSKSMLATDTAPSRLEHAKFILRELIKNDPQDRFGLVAFAGTAYTVCPLTSDPVAFGQYIDELNPDLVPVGGTNLEKALDAALRAFKAAGGANRAIVLFTDGDELEGSSQKILEELKKKKTPLFIVGLGDPAAGAPVPDGSGGFRRDEAGKLIVTKLAENKLIDAARATGGVYIRSTVTNTGVDLLENRIAALNTAEQESGVRTAPVEKFPLALIAAAVFLFLYFVISERPLKKSMLWLLLPLVFLCGAAENPLPKASETAKVVKNEEKLPVSPDALYNLAREKQLKGAPDAVKLYEMVLKKSSNRPDLQARSLFNIGSGIHRGGEAAAASALGQVQAQQLDPALEKLKEAGKRLDEAEELYAGALALQEASSFRKEAAGNLQKLEADRKKIEELKKKIEELKKQQQQAKQDAKNARDKNKQQQQQQNQKQQQQQQQQQNQKQQQQQAVDKAAQSSRELQKKAEELKQENLAKQAEKAGKELEKARSEKDEKKKQQHLDEAYKALGGDDDKKQDPQKDSKSDSKDRKDGKNDQQKLPAQKPQQAAEAKKEDKTDGKTAEQLLRMLNDEEKQRREELMKMRRMRRAPVKKDW